VQKLIHDVITLKYAISNISHMSCYTPTLRRNASTKW